MDVYNEPKIRTAVICNGQRDEITMRGDNNSITRSRDNNNIERMCNNQIQYDCPYFRTEHKSGGDI